MMRLSTAVLFAAVLALGACSGDDADAGSTTTTTSEPRETPSTTSTTRANGAATSTTQPPATDTEAAATVLQDLISRYDTAVAAILADPRVAADPASPEVQSYLSLFSENSAFADGALANWANEGEAGRFYRPGPRGQLTSSTVIGLTPAGDDEATFKICAENSMEITDAAGNVVESFGGQTAASVVTVRIDGIWRIRDLTQAPAADCPKRGADQ